VLFTLELHQQFLPLSSLPAAHSHLTVVPAQLFLWDYTLNWAKELFWAKNSPAKEKVSFYTGQFTDCYHRGLWTGKSLSFTGTTEECVHVRMHKLMSIRMEQY